MNVQPPLSGIRILDLTRNLPGPLATSLLGDMGADVIKLEDPRTGDPVRSMPPHVDGHSAFDLGVNRSKRSLAVDLKHPQGLELALKLAGTCDVVVEGFRPGVLARLGLGFDTLQEARADIILCSISGYGQTGPDRDRAGHDINYCARAGLLSQTGEANGAPMLIGAQVADVAGGTWQAVAAIYGALFQRERTGQGQWLDLAMADGVLSTMAMTLALQLAGFPAPTRGRGPLNGGLPSYGIFATADGNHLAVGALESYFFDALCDAMDLDDLRGQGLAFGAQAKEIKAKLAKRFAEHDLDHWIETFDGLDVCVEPVLDIEQTLAHPQYADRQMFFDLQGPTGPIRQMANPIKFAGCQTPERFPPKLGQHTAEILSELGYDSSQTKALRDASVVGLGEDI